MIYIPHVIISFFLVILHTTILNSFWLHSLGFVLLLSFLIFMACHRPVFESLVIVFLIGFLMDSFSGGPFGLFTSTYFWLFGLLKYSVQFLRLQNTHTIRFLLVFGILFENSILFSAMIFMKTGMSPTSETWLLLAGQIGLAVLFGPAFIRSISRLYGLWEERGSKRKQGEGQT